MGMLDSAGPLAGYPSDRIGALNDLGTMHNNMVASNEIISRPAKLSPEQEAIRQKVLRDQVTNPFRDVEQPATQGVSYGFSPRKQQQDLQNLSPAEQQQYLQTQESQNPQTINTQMRDQLTRMQEQQPTQLPPMLSGSGGLGQQGLGQQGLGALGGGQQNLNLGQVGLTFNPSGQGGGQGGGQGKGYTGWSFAEGGAVNQGQGLASLGRGQDSMLVHMTPGEVQGLQKLAMSAGGSLTINPQTGLPEAGFLSSMLPMIAGAGLMMIPGMQPLGAAAITGGVSALTSGSLKKGLMAGLGAYGGAGLGASLTSMGAEQANALASQELAAGSQAATTTGNAAADSALKFAEANKQAEIEKLVEQAAANPNRTMTPEAYRDFLTKQVSSTVAPTNIARPTDFVANPYSQEGIGYMQSQGSTGADIAQSAKEFAANASPMPAYNTATQEALARGPAGNMFAGVQQLGTKEGLKTLGGKLGYAGAASLAAPLLSSAMEPNKLNAPEKTPTQYYKADYRPPKYNPETGNYDPASYGPGSYYTNPTQYAAQGGAIGYAEGDLVAKPYRGGPGEDPKNSRDMYGSDSGAGINDNKTGRGVYSDTGGIHTNTPSGVEGLFAKTSAATLARYKTAKNAAMQAAAIKEIRKRANAVDDYGADTTSAAQGGLMGVHTYAAGGRLLRGPGDGMSDSIPAVIKGARPQRAALADGEFVIPADVVSHLGNGSTEAGSKHLYSMMDKVRKARTGNPKQGKQINPARFMPA